MRALCYELSSVPRQAGWRDDPFLGVKLVDPTWTRARWDQAQAALAQWQQQQRRARWQGSGMEARGDSPRRGERGGRPRPRGGHRSLTQEESHCTTTRRRAGAPHGHLEELVRTNTRNTGGGATARFILAQQSLADAEAAMRPAQARRVSDHLPTNISCRLADDARRPEATEGLGLCTVRLPEVGVGLSYGGVGGLSGSSHRRLVARETPLIRPSWLTALPRGEVLVRMKRCGSCGSRLLMPEPPATRAALGLTAVW